MSGKQISDGDTTASTQYTEDDESAVKLCHLHEIMSRFQI